MKGFYKKNKTGKIDTTAKRWLHLLNSLRLLILSLTRTREKLFENYFHSLSGSGVKVPDTKPNF
jgi:hypothetical protein